MKGLFQLKKMIKVDVLGDKGTGEKENNWALHVCPIKRGFEGSVPLPSVLLSKKIIVSPALKNDLYNILNKI